MPYGYDTSPSGVSGLGRKGEAIVSDAKAGSPKGSSGAYSDAGNAAEPGMGTIARNEINKPAMSKPSGSTSETGRMKP